MCTAVTFYFFSLFVDTFTLQQLNFPLLCSTVKRVFPGRKIAEWMVTLVFLSYKTKYIFDVLYGKVSKKLNMIMGK